MIYVKMIIRGAKMQDEEKIVGLDLEDDIAYIARKYLFSDIRADEVVVEDERTGNVLHQEWKIRNN